MKDDTARGLFTYRGYFLAAILLAVITWNAGSMIARHGDQAGIVHAWSADNEDLTVEPNESQPDHFIAALRKLATP